ncbi:hypothetical protein ACET3Z_012294 [Daucus carota]
MLGIFITSGDTKRYETWSQRLKGASVATFGLKDSKVHHQQLGGGGGAGDAPLSFWDQAAERGPQRQGLDHPAWGTFGHCAGGFCGCKLVGAMDRVMASHISGNLVPLLKQAGASWL